ncbi:MAG: hypothetical protein JWR52_35 [Marmoricola sp.]|nr:hypothetical protein [Marmoricola sp.]
MKLSKKFVASGVAVLATSALVSMAAVPAFADPVRPYATVGSDTIQDVWNGLTNDSTAVVPSIASFDATSNGVAYNTIHTKTAGTWFSRPNGSGDGQKAECATWDTTGDPTHLLNISTPASSWNLNNQEVDFARSSSGPSGTSGPLTYLPFARDAVSMGYNTQVVGAASSGLPSGLALTTADITALYKGLPSADGVVTFETAGGVAESDAHADATAQVFLNGVAGNNNGLAVGSSFQVFPTLPQSASGTRKFFASAAGISNTQGANAAYVSDAPGSVTGTGAPYEENNGRALTVAGAIIPFSAAQWISQQTGAATNTLNNTTMAIASFIDTSNVVNAAVIGSGSSAAQGPMFGSTDFSGNFNVAPVPGVGVFNRDTYDIIAASFIGGTPKQSALVSTLSGGGTGQIFSSGGKTIIKKFGFGVLSYSTGTGSALPGTCPAGY